MAASLPNRALKASFSGPGRLSPAPYEPALRGGPPQAPESRESPGNPAEDFSSPRKTPLRPRTRSSRASSVLSVLIQSVPGLPQSYPPGLACRRPTPSGLAFRRPRRAFRVFGPESFAFSELTFRAFRHPWPVIPAVSGRQGLTSPFPQCPESQEAPSVHGPGRSGPRSGPRPETPAARPEPDGRTARARRRPASRRAWPQRPLHPLAPLPPPDRTPRRTATAHILISRQSDFTAFPGLPPPAG
jgi:hypothetical protein